MKFPVAMPFFASLLLLGGSAAAQESQALLVKSSVELPNVKGRIDHFSVDLKGQRLFMAGVGDNILEVIDLQAGKLVRTLTDLAEPQGVYYDAATNRLYVACGGDGLTKIYDATTFQVLGTVKFPDDADNIRYDARSKSVIVGYAGAKELRKRTEGTGGLGFIDSSSGKLTRQVVIDAHPESFRLEEKGTRIFVNVPDNKEIEVVDAEKGTILALFYDSARGRIYVLNGLGSIDVFQQKDADHYDRFASLPTPPGSRTGLFVPELGTLFVGVLRQGDKNAEVRVYQAN